MKCLAHHNNIFLSKEKYNNSTFARHGRKQRARTRDSARFFSTTKCDSSDGERRMPTMTPLSPAGQSARPKTSVYHTLPRPARVLVWIATAHLTLEIAFTTVLTVGSPIQADSCPWVSKCVQTTFEFLRQVVLYTTL